VALIMVGVTVVFGLAVFAAAGWPFLPFDAERTPLLPLTIVGAFVCWTSIAVIAAWRRRRGEAGGVLVVTTVHMYAVTLALFTLAAGPFGSAGWVGFLGGAVVGYLLFDRVIALSGLMSYATLVVAGALMLRERVWPALDGLLPPSSYAELSRAAVVRLSVSSLLLFGVSFAVIAFIIDSWRDRERLLQHMARTDGLTGLTNRRTFLELAERELLRARRYGSPMAVVLIDLDHFKRINDTHGHQAGDRVLVHAAHTLADAVRDVDTVARFGGEEFAILLPATDATGAVEVAQRCARRVADGVVTLDDGLPVVVTASMGVAVSAPHEPLDGVLRRADQALYRAKEAGRDRVEMAHVDPPPACPPPDRVVVK
jgi:diguanylate cyclase (GGDEF)-like protein